MSCFDRRRRRVGERIVERLHLAAAADAPMLVANAVPDRLAQIRRERPLTLRLESIQPPERAHDDVVDQVGRVGTRAGPSRKTAVGPAADLRQVHAKERVERARFAAARRAEETPRCAAGVSVQPGCVRRRDLRRHGK